jgi:hypothetical protein
MKHIEKKKDEEGFNIRKLMYNIWVIYVNYSLIRVNG